MHILNSYFTPFAVLLTVFAVYFSMLDRKTTFLTFGVLFAAFLINWILAKNEYKFFKWVYRIRVFTVIFNLIVTTIIFYLIGSYWAPSWLLYLIAPATAAMFMKKYQVFFISVVSAALMLSVYYFKSGYLGLSLGEVQWAMASIQALFVIIFTMFVNSMAQTAVKLRDTMTR